MSTSKLRDHDKDQLLAVLGYYMSQELRQKLMLECPQAYNAWMGGEYVRVHRVSDGEAIVPGVIPVTRIVFESEDQELLRLAGRLAAEDDEIPEVGRRNGMRIMLWLKQAVASENIQFLRDNKDEIRTMAKVRKWID